MALTILSSKLSIMPSGGNGANRVLQGTAAWSLATTSDVLPTPGFTRVESIQLTPVGNAPVAGDLAGATAVPNADGSLPIASGGVAIGRAAGTTSAGKFSFRVEGR